MTQQDATDKLDRLRKWSKTFHIVVISVTAVLVISMWLLFKLHADAVEKRRADEEARLAEQYRIEQVQQAERDRAWKQRIAREQAIADSIRIARMSSYTLDDVREMVMKVAPSSAFQSYHSEI